MPNLILMIGPPGSGKTWHTNYIILNSKNLLEVISADDIRRELYGSAEVQGGKEVWDKFYERLDKAVEDQIDTVIDNTNLKLKYRKNIIDRCPNYDIKYVVMLTPLWQCLKRNAARDRQVPEEVICNMYRTFMKEYQNLLFETPNIEFVREDF